MNEEPLCPWVILGLTRVMLHKGGGGTSSEFCVHVSQSCIIMSANMLDFKSY